MRPGQTERRSHDYTRHGTLSLFAALDVATGKVIAKCFARHRGREFLKFLREIETNVPLDLDVHLVMDNYSTHKDSSHSPMAGQTSALACSLHANLRVVDQPG